MKSLAPKSDCPDERRRSVATRKAVGLLDRSAGLPDTFWYSTKRRLLGPPLVNQDLGEQRLSNPLALGVLSPDGISSSAYGTEEILIALVPVVGLAAFSLLLPMTLVTGFYGMNVAHLPGASSFGLVTLLILASGGVTLAVLFWRRLL